MNFEPLGVLLINISSKKRVTLWLVHALAAKMQVVIYCGTSEVAGRGQPLKIKLRIWGILHSSSIVLQKILQHLLMSLLALV